MMNTKIRFASFLAPKMFPVYQFIADYVGDKLGIATELVTGESFDQFERGEVDAGYICGLPYVDLTRRRPAPVELLAAPVLEGDRYRDRPIYFSDVIVRLDRPYRSFAELRGCSWSYNDPDSQSGYGITRYWLARMGETGGFFGRVVEAGFHQRSVQMVATGEIDASAIDSQVLAIELRDHAELAEQVKVIDALGPSTIQPVVAASRLPEGLKADLRAVYLEIGQDPAARQALDQGLIRRFAEVEDSTYDDIREMVRVCEDVGLLEIR
jgi:phosphonate transport system substrate-binding protein